MNSLSLFLRKSTIAILFLLLYSSSGYTAPQIRQIFPSHPFLLGQTRVWTIEVRHPIWEAYTLKINEVEGADITIVDTRSRIESEEMISLYRFKIVPSGLSIQDTPSILVSDGKGQNTVVNGEPLIVRSISGDSLALKEALPPVLPLSAARSLIIYVVMLILLGSCLSVLVWRRKRASTPKQVLRRQMKRVLKEIALTPNKYPAALEKIFRSEFFWGIRADARTASELFEVAGSDPYLKQLAETLQYLEQYRYSDPATFTAQDRIRQSILAGLEILR